MEGIQWPDRRASEQITYTCADVPEPSTYWLVALSTILAAIRVVLGAIGYCSKASLAQTA
jgi:hypothetical protein